MPTPRTAVEPRRWTLHGLNNGWLFKSTVRGVSVLPRSVSYAIGYAGTWIAWRVMPQTNQALADNLRAVFPGETSGQLRRRALTTYRAYALDTIDFLRTLAPEYGAPNAQFTIPETTVALFRELAKDGRGFLLVTGHYGNWEVGSALMKALDLPLTVVAMPEADGEVNEIRREIRDRLGTDTLEVRQSMDTALQIRRRLAEGRSIALLMDRHLGRDRIEVEFLGRRTWFLRTPAVLARLSGAPMVPCFIERLGPGRFYAEAEAPIYVDAAGDRDATIRQATQQFAAKLEARVRAHPEYWYHFYRYWDAQSDAYAPDQY
jgi:KDO2-lipid IV(A) lauroyltransferase